MKLISQPKKTEWEALCKRPALQQEDLTKKVRQILDRVKELGDQALYEYSSLFDNAELTKLKVTKKEIAEAEQKLSEELKRAIQVAKTNIETFHKAQLMKEPAIETIKGVLCWRRSVPIEKVGLYIPGGSAPLFSTVLMLGIPAGIAGCKERILCTPCDKNSKVHPAILYAAQITGITSIYKIGGAQAIAAMAYGTATVPKVNKIFGPGNQYVTKAKELVQLDGLAIDMPAGPSEVLVIADPSGNPEFIAADLLAQAEHSADSQVVLLSDSVTMIEAVNAEIQTQLAALPRKQIAQKALENSFAVVFKNMDSCMKFSNYYAPEHLILAVKNAKQYAKQVTSAGSVFVGNYSCESAGDYASGTNHTLPTNGFAKSFSGVSTESFIKKITFQEITKKGIKDLGPDIELLAEAEQLFAHKNAVTVRLKSLKK